MIVKTNVLRVLAVLWMGLSLTGCISLISNSSNDIIVQAFAHVDTENPAEDKSGSFFLRRSLLCRKVFADAMTNLVAQTGRSEDALCGATICGIDEGFTNGVYSLKLDVTWSAVRETATFRILSATNVATAIEYVPSVDDERAFATWIGPKQIFDDDGTIHFLGFSAMAVGHNTVLSQQNIRMAELDAQAMAARSFMGKDRKMADVKAEFREVFRLRSRHPLCPDRDMFVCGYEVVSLELPTK